MWYFAWILGVSLAVAFGVLNGLWHELQRTDEGDPGADGALEPLVAAPRPAPPAVKERRR